MGKATRPLVIADGDSHGLDRGDGSEELLYRLLLGLEAQVANEKSGDLAVTSLAWVVSTGSLA